MSDSDFEFSLNELTLDCDDPGGKIDTAALPRKREQIASSDALDYEKIKEKARQKAAALSLSGRDIGDIPAVVNPERKAACRTDLALFCKTYFPDIFQLPWSEIHLDTINRLQQAAMHGGQFAIAMPRGYGKTQLCAHSAIWAAVFGYRQFIVVVGAEDKATRELMRIVKIAFETNELLKEDFPEIAYPVQCLEGIVNRCAGQLCKGQRTHIEWGDQRLVFPNVPNSQCACTVINTATLTGRLRGMNYTTSYGENRRPDFVIIDDPQSRESAKSLSQVSDRLSLVNSDVLGMAGPRKTITVVMPCTVIYPHDVADQMLDRQLFPEWQGKRYGILDGFPKNLQLWQRYREIRAQGLREDRGFDESNRFYVTNRQAMDEGCKSTWPENFRADELSGIQFAMDKYFESKSSFYSEYQNEPLAQDLGSGERITAEDVWKRLSRLRPLEIPQEVTKISMGVDVQQGVLFYTILGFAPDFTSWVLDYGVYPEQPSKIFKAANASPTYGDIYPGCGGEAALTRALQDCVLPRIRQAYTREDGVELRISRCLVDAGYATQTVYDFVRTSGEAALMPSRGLGITATSSAISERKRKPGEIVSGYEWRIAPVKNSRRVRVCFFDANWWKTFFRNRLKGSSGDMGALKICGTEVDDHLRLLAEHWTSEYSVEDISGSRRTETWKAIPNRENHWLDCTVLTLVGASEQGAALIINPATVAGTEAKPTRGTPGRPFRKIYSSPKIYTTQKIYN